MLNFGSYYSYHGGRNQVCYELSQSSGSNMVLGLDVKMYAHHGQSDKFRLPWSCKSIKSISISMTL